ncbi:MAG: tRNA preQ1(34) S-adenosylmethionine ribosyltransferase-isomerase QueA [Chthoniobacterales bacterium]
MSLLLSDYDYLLPEELIAQHPLPRREDSRMLVLHRATERIEHRVFSDLGDFMTPGDLLVLNDTRVINARRFSDDGTIEFLFLEPLGARRWRSLVKPGRKMRVGASTSVDGVAVHVVEVCADGSRVLALADEIDLEKGGAIPLPPYMRRTADAQDQKRYQTVFARVAGAAAAPTAGLHFTPELLERWPHTFVTLHVGTGTFAPVKTETITDHVMHEERFSISPEAADAINAASRIIAVGTTTVRVMESAQRDPTGKLAPQDGATSIFLHPPQKIAHADALLTNFHLPRSTLLMLVSAFASREFILRAYAEAIRERYRFYSYGDCMLVL